jgi:hypothetical protein
MRSFGLEAKTSYGFKHGLFNPQLRRPTNAIGSDPQISARNNHHLFWHRLIVSNRLMMLRFAPKTNADKIVSLP